VLYGVDILALNGGSGKALVRKSPSRIFQLCPKPVRGGVLWKTYVLEQNSKNLLAKER